MQRGLTSASQQKVSKLSFSDSFIELPSAPLECSAVLSDEFDQSQIHVPSKGFRSDIVQELNTAMRQLHTLLRDNLPTAQASLHAEFEQTDDLMEITHSLNKYTCLLRESLSKGAQTSYRLDSAQKEAVEVHEYMPGFSKLSILDKVFSKKAVSFDAEETQALASVVIGAMRDSASEELQKRMAVMQNNYICQSAELLELRKLLRRREAFIQEQTQRLSTQAKE
jgi:hypothetical protein